MASKLDQTIATVAIAISQRSNLAMVEAAVAAAPQVSAKDIAKMPDRWYPAIGARAAGVPDLQDQWQSYWFEALTEILCQKKAEGVPALLTLMNREDSTTHSDVVVRLLRLAAEGIETDLILAQVRSRLETLHYVKTNAVVRDVVNWMTTDRRPLELLRPMADIVIPRSDGDTVGKYITQYTGELPILLERGHVRT